MLTSFTRFALPIALLAVFLSYVFPSAASTESSKDLICHTADRAECYPAIFTPTKDFQIIHDDQSIPPGLHVRMNIATGVKEARLNVPEGDGGDNSAVFMIENSAVGDEIVQQAPQKPVTGGLNVQDPRHINHVFDADSFPLDARNYTTTIDSGDVARAASVIVKCRKYKPDICLVALEDLTELAHDLEWGVAITKDEKLSSQLWQLVESSNLNGDIRVPSAAALLLGTTLQNNEKALQEMLSGFPKARQPEGVVRKQLALVHKEHGMGRSTLQTNTYAKRLVFLLSQLCTEHDQLYSFVHKNGLSTLSGLVTTPVNAASSEAKSKLLHKIVNFVDGRALDIVHQVNGKANLVEMCHAVGTYLREVQSLERFEIKSSAPLKKTLEDTLGLNCD